MNIFYLSSNPVKAAEYHCDKHVLKMIIEYAQLLSTAHRVLDANEDRPYPLLEDLYKKTHENHPCGKWVRSNVHHYQWVYDCFEKLLYEYRDRYNKKTDHKSKTLLEPLMIVPINIPHISWSDPPQCMPEAYKSDDTVEAYRRYYIDDKSRIAKWRTGNYPDWWPESLMEMAA